VRLADFPAPLPVRAAEQAGVGLLLGEQKDSSLVSVKQVVPRGSADRTNRIRVGDQVPATWRVVWRMARGHMHVYMYMYMYMYIYMYMYMLSSRCSLSTPGVYQPRGCSVRVFVRVCATVHVFIRKFMYVFMRTFIYV